MSIVPQDYLSSTLQFYSKDSKHHFTHQSYSHNPKFIEKPDTVSGGQGLKCFFLLTFLHFCTKTLPPHNLQNLDEHNKTNVSGYCYFPGKINAPSCFTSQTIVLDHIERTRGFKHILMNTML